MRRYETIFILDPDLAEDQRKLVLDRVTDLITQYKGFLVEFEEWGSRKLAYEIKKKVRGFYIRLDYCGAGDLVDEMERAFRIDDRVLKYMTILLEEDADLEAIKAEMAAKAEQQAQTASTASEPSAVEAAATPAETEPQSTRDSQEEA
jgi:small subunit ribosomal protein S6